MRLTLVPLAAALAAAASFSHPASAQPAPQPLLATPYPGEIALQVDATDVDRKILRVRQTMPVKPGPLTLFFPRWLPGEHAPNGDVNQLAGLKISARGQPLPWTRDPLDTHAFRVTVPSGVSQLELAYENLSPASPQSGRVTVTREMLNIQWQAVVLYPAGWQSKAITVRPTLKLPEGWQAGTALRPDGAAERAEGNTLRFKPVSLEMLVDSPVFAGRNFRRIELDPPGTPRPVVLNIVADTPDRLNPTETQIEAHRELVRQADKLFASRHYQHYDFLFALTEEMGGIGLEHHQSSENGVRPTYWENWERRTGSRELLPHEYTHSWNGKFRRPADLATPHFNVPMQNSLLWLYEGQTQFWGWVLAARSGLTTPQQARDNLARNAASYDQQPGRQWRSLQDTTNDAIYTMRRQKDWRAYQRTGGDYYGEMLLIWLEADTLIREMSGGKKSMDDFARAFFGVNDGELGPLPYRFEDIVATLNGVQPYDWSAFLRQRLDATGGPAPLEGLARGGWKLVYSEQPSDSTRADEMEERYADFTYSLGFTIGSPRGGQAQGMQGGDGRISAVQWGGPAFEAGMGPGATVVAVNNIAYKPDNLRRAVTANKEGKAPIELLLREGERYRTVRIDYRGGLRYPRLERVAGTEDRLGALLQRR